MHAYLRAASDSIKRILRTLAAQWGIAAGRSWELLEGLEGGQTQVDAALCEGEPAVWGHPVDIHFACRGLSGWPRLHFQVRHSNAPPVVRALGKNPVRVTAQDFVILSTPFLRVRA
jgi:hypothetical protein